MDFFQRYIELGFPQDKSFSVARSQVVRLNTLAAPKAQILRSIPKEVTLTPVTYLQNGFSITAPFAISSSKSALLGFLYVQEPASQLASEILNPQPTDIVLDMCAAPGSKTTHLAQLMGNSGTIVACDMKKDRVQKLCYNLERCHVTNTQVLWMDAKDLDEVKYRGYFDKILLDAPCSGNYAIDDKWESKRSMSGVLQNAAVQRDLVRKAAILLKPGGVLLYATCSLELEENEQIVEYTLSSTSLSLLPISAEIKKSCKGEHGLSSETQGCMRLWPSLTGTQGFFYALFEKKVV